MEGIVLIISGMGSCSSFRGDRMWGLKASIKPAVWSLIILTAEGAGAYRAVYSNCSVDQLVSIAILGLQLK